MIRTLAAIAIWVLSGRPALWAEHWPSWRGPHGNGVSGESPLPVHWSRQAGVAWRTPLPGKGNGSPIVWADKVFVASETGDGGVAALCVAADTGRILWTTRVPGGQAGDLHEKNSLASSSPVTDGRRVYWMFGFGLLVATDLEGRLLWTHRFPPPRLVHGHGSSPALCGDLVLQAYESNQDSVLYAFAKENGRLVWQSPPGPKLGWSTPVVVRAAGRRLIVRNSSSVIATDPQTGQTLWTVPGMALAVVPTIVFDDRYIFSASGRDGPVVAIDPATGREVWRRDKCGPYIPSPVVYGGRYFQVKDFRAEGLLTCLAADTGQVLYTARLTPPYTASPVAGDGKVYFSNERGLVTVIDAASPQLKVLAENDLGETLYASPAISGGRLYFRTAQALYAINGCRAEP